MCRRRGGVLLEVVLAVALFGGAASFTLAAVRSVFTTLDRSRAQQEAVDLARSKLAELEAGLITLADLRDAPAAGAPWIFQLQTQRTEFTGLTLVELTVIENLPGSQSDSSQAMRFTLRQLVQLREGIADDQ